MAAARMDNLRVVEMDEAAPAVEAQDLSEAPSSSQTPVASQPPPFLMKTYEMVDDESTAGLVSWNADGKSFVVWTPPEFARDILPKYFKHSNFSSFVRQLNTYGFRKVDTDKWAFAHDNFRRGRQDMLKDIHRRRAAPGDRGGPRHAGAMVPTGQAVLEVGKFGVENEIEQLKRDKNVLMLELMRVRNQQQQMQNQMESYSSRLERQEKIANNVMTFLSNAVQNPAVLAEFMSKAQAVKSSGTGRVRKRRHLDSDDGGSTAHVEDDEDSRGSPTAEDVGMAITLRSPQALGKAPSLNIPGPPPILSPSDSMMRMNTSELVNDIAAAGLLSDDTVVEADEAGAMSDKDFSDMMRLFENSDIDGALTGEDMSDLLQTFNSDSFRVN